MRLQQGLIDLAIVCLIAVLTSIVAGLSRLLAPQVVILIVGGC